MHNSTLQQRQQVDHSLAQNRCPCLSFLLIRQELCHRHWPQQHTHRHTQTKTVLWKLRATHKKTPGSRKLLPLFSFTTHSITARVVTVIRYTAIVSGILVTVLMVPYLLCPGRISADGWRTYQLCYHQYQHQLTTKLQQKWVHQQQKTVSQCNNPLQ